MPDLFVNFERLDESHRKVDDVLDGFAGITSSTHEAAQFVGHDGLAGRVREFSDGWDKKRGKLSRELQSLADAFEAISDTFLTLDERLAVEHERALEDMQSGGASATPAGAAAGGR